MAYAFNPFTGQLDVVGEAQEFQPNPEILPDSVSDALYNIPSVGTQRFGKTSSSLYTYINYFIEKRGAVWVAGFVTEDGGGNLIETIIVTSLSDGTYPWQATWPSGTVVEKAPAVRLTGQPDTANGTEGVSSWAARADHTHPSPPNLPDQPVNTDSSPGFLDVYAASSLYYGSDFTSDGELNQFGLKLPSIDIGSTPEINRRSRLMRTDENLFLGHASNGSWNKLAMVGSDNSFTQGQTINSGSLNVSVPALALTQTWISSGMTFSAMTVDITDTASNASSLLCNLRVGGVSRFSVSKSGILALTNSSNLSCFIASDAANTLAQRNGTNAQIKRLYGTFTDASNGRWLNISTTTAGLVTLTATGNGTGASGNLLKLTAPILLPATSVSLVTNGDLAFEATSNTSLTIRYRGSDGTTRSASLILT